MMPSLSIRAMVNAVVVLTGTACAMGQGFVPPPNANIANVVTDYGAIPNDGLDDLAAFQAALNALVGSGRMLYIPDGAYTFSDRLNWGGVNNGGFIHVQGQSRDGVVFRLRDNAPGFQDPNNRRVFVDVYEGNTANQFRTYLSNVTIDVGAGNPGAVGLEFQTNNTGRLENVTIRSSDPARAGVAGLALAFNFPGPMLVRNILIEGFDEGIIGAPQEYSVTLEHITLKNQRVRGIGVWRLPLQIRNLVSENAVPVLESFTNPGAWGHVVIDGGTFGPGLSSPGPTTDAVINNPGAGVIVLRNVTTSGYRFAVRDESAAGPPITLPSGPIAQHTTDAPASTHASPAQIAPIPVLDAPPIPDFPVSQWVSVKSFGAIENDNLDDTDAVQAAMASGAPVVYFPSGLYTISRTIDVGPSVHRIEGLLSQVRFNAPLTMESGSFLRIGPGSQPVVHVRGLNLSFQSPALQGGGAFFEQATANTLVVRDGDISYRNSVAGGRVFLENVVGNDMIFTGQRVWARQLNPEGSGGAHVINDGGDLYVLGHKTEGDAIVLENRNRARAVILGGLIYPSTPIPDRTKPMILNSDSWLSISLPESCYIADGSYAVWVRDTRGGSTIDFTRGMLPQNRTHSVCGGQIALYTSWQPDATPASTPGTPVQNAATLSSVTISWAPALDAESGVARYNVYRNGVFLRSVMPSATPALVDTGLADGASFTYRVSAVNGAGVESSLSGAVVAGTLADTTAPMLVSARTGLDPRVVLLEFSEPLNTASAGIAGNYAISGSAPVSVLAAVPSIDGRSVTLTTSAMSPGVHTLVMQGITDRSSASNAIAAGTRAGFSFSNTSSGTGLTGQYFTNRDFTGAPVLTRVDPLIDFTYPGAPAPGLPADGFATRWVGQLQPRFSEDTTIFIRSDDGARVFLDGRLILGRWIDQGPTEISTTVKLDASRTHDLVVEHYDAAGGALVQLSWQSASMPKQIVPTSALLPTPLLTTSRTWQGAGAETTLERTNTNDNGSATSFGTFHSPASGGFHSAGFVRFDLAPFDLGNTIVVDGVATFTQTFFGIGSGKRLINFFGVRNDAAGDAWIETGPGHVTWNTAAGNTQSASQASPQTARWIDTFLLDNSNFQNNNQHDKASISGQALLDLVREDTDGRISLLLKRFDASNEGQGWFSKEWGIPGAAPALKLQLAPRCPAILTQPSAPQAQQGSAIALTARVRGAGPLAYQWQRNGINLVDGPGGAAPGGGVVRGASGVLDTAAQGPGVGLQILGTQPADSGSYRLVLTNACGTATSVPTVLDVISTGPTCDGIDFNNDGIENDPTDIEAFLSVYSGGPCVPAQASCADIDFNNDGIENDPTDIEAFLSVYSGGPCL